MEASNNKEGHGKERKRKLLGEVDVGIHLSIFMFLFCWPLLLFFAFILYTFSSSSYYACL